FQSVKMDIKPVCKKTIIKPDKTTSPEAIIILPEKNGLNVFQETGVSCFFCHINNKIMYASAPSQKAIAIWWNTRGASATNGCSIPQTWPPKAGVMAKSNQSAKYQPRIIPGIKASMRRSSCVETMSANGNCIKSSHLPFKMT